MVTKGLKSLLVVLLITLSSPSFGDEQGVSDDALLVAKNQVARAFLIGAVLMQASYEYYHYYQQCPDSLEALSFPSLTLLTTKKINVRALDSLVSVPMDNLLLIDQLTINKQCHISLRFKDKEPVVAALRGKEIRVELDASKQQATATCHLNADPAYAPPIDCQFAATDANRLPAVDLAIASKLYSLYQDESKAYKDINKHRYFLREIVYTLSPLINEVDDYYSQQQQCPADDKAFAQAIGRVKNYDRLNQISAINLQGCQLSVELANNQYVLERFKGKVFQLTKQLDKRGKWVCSASQIDSVFVPNDCWRY